MQQAGRLRLRPWLEEQIQSGRYPGVSWLDQSARIFQIPWKHAARHGWSIDQDATLFRSWAMHTGRYRPGKDKPDPKTWKANFRCALNSLPDICELHEHSRKRGNNAYRVYRMMPSKQSQRRRKGLRLFRKSQEIQESDANEDAFSIWKQSSTRPNLDTPQNVETPTDNTLGSSQTTGMWEAKPEDQEQTDAIFKLMDHFGNADLWNQTGEQRGWRTHTLWEQWHCTGDDTAYSLYTANYNDPLGQSYIKELSDWSTHQQTLMP